MFPNNETAKNYGCARTKTSSIINEYSSGCQKTLISVIKKIPFCISTDGNNDTDVKIYPIIISFFYHNPDNLKDDDDILIGHGTSIAVKSLSCTQKDQFYDHVKKFYTKACDYAFHKFPFNDEMLKHAKVCNLDLISSASFVDVKYFIDKFPIFLSSVGCSIDDVQAEFCNLQLFKLPEAILNEKRIDIQWCLVRKIKNILCECPFSKISEIMLHILSVPYSNAEREKTIQPD